jgi:hypothetical protein
MLARYRLKDTLPQFLPHIQSASSSPPSAPSLFSLISLTGVMDDYRSSPDQLKNHSAKEACLVALAAVANVPNSSLHTFHIANTHLFLLFRSSKRRSHTAIKLKGSSSLMSSQNFLYDICTSLSCTTLLTPLL